MRVSILFCTSLYELSLEAPPIHILCLVIVNCEIIMDSIILSVYIIIHDAYVRNIIM